MNKMKHRFLNLLGKITWVTAAIISAAFLGWLSGNALLKNQLAQSEAPIDNTPVLEEEVKVPQPSKKLDFPPLDDLEPEPETDLPKKEQKRQEILRLRRLDLGIKYDFYLELVNEEFWRQYPAKAGVVLTNQPEDKLWRSRWAQIATKTLEQLTFLSSQARRQLGTRTSADQDSWTQQANQLHVSSRALYDLADAQLRWHLPHLVGKDVNSEPIAQIWRGIVFDQLQALRSGKKLAQLTFSPETRITTVGGTLQPGEGKVYLAQLDAGQLQAVNLEAPYQVQLSIYSPTGNINILEDSQQRYWSGEVSEQGYYEFIIVSQAPETIEYQLNIQLQP